MPKIQHPHPCFLSTSRSTYPRTVKFIAKYYSFVNIATDLTAHRNTKEHARQEHVDIKFKIETTKKNIKTEKIDIGDRELEEPIPKASSPHLCSPYSPVKMIRQGVCWFLVPIFSSLFFSLFHVAPYTFYSLIKRVCRSVGDGASPSVGMVCRGKWLRFYTPVQGEGKAPEVTMNT